MSEPKPIIEIQSLSVRYDVNGEPEFINLMSPLPPELLAVLVPLIESMIITIHPSHSTAEEE